MSPRGGRSTTNPSTGRLLALGERRREHVRRDNAHEAGPRERLGPQVRGRIKVEGGGRMITRRPGHAEAVGSTGSPRVSCSRTPGCRWGRLRPSLT